MKPGTVVFAGAGPGAPDLVTVRCRDAIAAAEVIVYAGSLVNPEVLKGAPPACRVYDSAEMSLAEIVQTLVQAAREGKRVLRLHTGDPAIYGAIAEQMRGLDEAGVPYEVIPGVSSVFACAAALKRELTLPGVSQTVILTRRAGRTPVPPGQDIASLAAHRATMAVFLSAGDLEPLVQELRAGGYGPETPAAVVYRASWPDQRVVTGTLSDIAGRAAEAGIVRQAIVLVGEALQAAGEASRLYAADFAHGYRDASAVPLSPPAAPAPAEAPGFAGTVAVYALTESGARTAARLAAAVGGSLFLSRERGGSVQGFSGAVERFPGQELEQTVAAQWRRFDGHVFVMASGIVVRKIAPLLVSKTRDPAVVVCDENGRYAISLLSGHIGGANRLAQQAAAVLQGQAVVTTATDVQGLMAFDEWAARQGWRVETPGTIKQLNSLLLARKRVGIALPPDVVRQAYGGRENVVPVDPAALPGDIEGLVVLDRPDFAGAGAIPVLRLARPGVVLGIGCNRGVPEDAIEAAVQDALRGHRIEPAQVRGVASLDLKRDEEGLLAVARRHGWALTFFSAEELGRIAVPNPSAAVEDATGTASVAEAAAIAASGGRLLVPKQKYDGITVAVAAVAGERAAGGGAGRLVAVGIGPGTPEGLTLKARSALLAADVVVGYKPYCEQVRWLIGDKPTRATGMRSEVARCEEAIREARSGRTVAVVCSGDAGVYGMAGLLLELLADSGGAAVEVDVVPGITAATEAAALLGAPLMNDFAVISLSDLLTPRETILRRLEAVAACGMPCALYNPRSHTRTDLFERALAIFAAAGGPTLACGTVRHAGRAGQQTWVGLLNALPVEAVDMSTIVIIGGADTAVLNGRLVTRRGYRTDGERC